MTPDEVIELRRLWARHNYRGLLPDAVVLAEQDWLAYVAAMAEAVPTGQEIEFPSEEDVRWAWPDGVAMIFATPVEIEHAIVSKDVPGSFGPTLVPVEAHNESQLCRGCLIGPVTPTPVRTPDGVTLDEKLLARPAIWIGDDPTDIISGSWLAGTMMLASKTGVISHSSRFLLALLTALGHRLTRIEEPGGTRHERRRVQRELPELRVLKLSTGASVSRSEGSGTVEWSRRWMVRGHWHTVAHGPRKSLRRVQWYDPYVKGPEDKPLDVRDTIWRTGEPPAA